MQFPVYQVPFLGNGMVIGVNAVIHVLISHGVAIGAFAMVVLADWARPANDGLLETEWEHHRKRLLKFTVLAITTVGAITGVGIWFTTTVLAPRGIASMLRVFFWAWFAEWIVFLLEVSATLVYFQLWDRLGLRRRLRIGLGIAYLGVALLTAAIITGNLGFMLTPGDWPSGRQLWQAFLNPTYIPQLVCRLAIAAIIGSLIATAFASFGRHPPAFKQDALRLYGPILMAGVAVLCLGLVVYFREVPRAFTDNTAFSVLTSRLSQSRGLLAGLNALAFAVVLATGILAWQRRARLVRYAVIPAMVLAAAFVGEFERVREFIRGPYLMPGYMYVNGVLLEETPRLAASGMLPDSYWYQASIPKDRPHAAGAYLFSQNCSACHTIGGINDIRSRTRDLSEDGLFVLLGHTHELASFMPPFSGTTEERRLLASFLYQLSQGNVRMESYSRHIPAAPGGQQ